MSPSTSSLTVSCSTGMVHVTGAVVSAVLHFKFGHCRHCGCITLIWTLKTVSSVSLLSVPTSITPETDTRSEDIGWTVENALCIWHGGRPYREPWSRERLVIRIIVAIIILIIIIINIIISITYYQYSVTMYCRWDCSTPSSKALAAQHKLLLTDDWTQQRRSHRWDRWVEFKTKLDGAISHTIIVSLWHSHSRLGHVYAATAWPPTEASRAGSTSPVDDPTISRNQTRYWFRGLTRVDGTERGEYLYVLIYIYLRGGNFIGRGWTYSSGRFVLVVIADDDNLE